MQYITLLVVEILGLYLLSHNVHQKLGQLFLRITKSKKWTTTLLAILYLPGTFIHEVAHFLTALVLLVPVGQPEFMPEIQDGNKLKLGSVPIGKTDPIRRFIIGISPVVFGLTIIFLGLNYLLSHNLLSNLPHILLAAYFIFTISNSMFSSRKDLEETWKLLVIIIILIVIYYLLRLPIPDLRQLTLPTQITEVLKQTSLFLAIPITINIVLLATTKRLN